MKLKKIGILLFTTVLTLCLSSCDKIDKKDEVRSLNLNRSSITMKIGDTTRLAAYYSNNDDVTDATWISDNTYIATVSDSGKVEAVGVGNTVISVSDNKGLTKECDVKVEGIAVENVELNKKRVEIEKNKTIQLQANIYPENATDQNVKWISDDDTIAIVNSNGLVTGKNAGTINITCRSSSGKEASCTVTVKNTISNDDDVSDNEDYDSYDSNLQDAQTEVSFYGIWCGAAKTKSGAEKEAQSLRKKGIDAEVFLTTDWSNLNSEKWYVVSAGVYEDKSTANAALPKVKKIYPSAYVKYSGDWMG